MHNYAAILRRIIAIPFRKYAMYTVLFIIVVYNYFSSVKMETTNLPALNNAKKRMEAKERKGATVTKWEILFAKWVIVLTKW